MKRLPFIGFIVFLLLRRDRNVVFIVAARIGELTVQSDKGAVQHSAFLRFGYASNLILVIYRRAVALLIAGTVPR